MKKWNNGLKLGLFIIMGLMLWGTAQADVTFSIRYEDNLFFEGTSTLIGGTTVMSATDSVTSNPVDVTISKDTVLGVLSEIDSVESGFSLSTLTYYASFSSLYLQCITVDAKEACDNWKYVVNGVDPGVGMDLADLVDGDSVYIYYGPSRRTVLSKSNVYAGEEFEVTAQSYKYTDNTWETLTGVTIGVTQTDPDNPWTPIEVVTKVVDSEGIANFQVSSEGSYNIGIKEDFYFPTIALSVQELGVAVAPKHEVLDVDRAINFLSLNQESNGSMLDSSLLSDWTAIAFGAYEDVNFGREELRNYLLSDPNPGSSITDYERRAMALLALDINPYSGTNTNYVEKILDSFDGKQFGNPDFVNDDIFALFVLLKSGYTDSDPVIVSTVNFIISQQWVDGSWNSVDMTAAAVQALSLTPLLDGVSSALYHAKNYMYGAQNETGGFGNVFSTSWALQTLQVLEQDEIWWQKGNHTPGDYLNSMQAEDGGVNEEDSLANRIWATAYAIPATMQQTWGDILYSFSKPVSSEEILVFFEKINNNQELLLEIESELALVSKEVVVLKKEVALFMDANEPRYLAKAEESEINKEVVLLDGVTELPEPEILAASIALGGGNKFFSKNILFKIFIWGVGLIFVAFFLYVVFLLGRAYSSRRYVLEK